MRRLGVALLIVGVCIVAGPLWVPWLGTGLAVDQAIQPGDVALVLEGTGKDALDVAETWRQQGLVRKVVVVEAPVKTHALVAYWSDFISWGLASPSPTPAEHLRVIRAPTTQAAKQAEAVLPALLDMRARLVLVPGGGGIGSRLVERELVSVFSRENVEPRLVRYGNRGRDPARWWQNAEDRRAVLDTWLQLLVPFLSGYQPGS
jgi:hypothetical protein